MKRKAKIYYTSLDDFWRKEEKLGWLRDNPISKIAFERLEPDAKHNWINQTDNDFETLLPLIDKDVKLGKKEEAVFRVFSLGVATNRDEWVYDLDKINLRNKIEFFIKEYQKDFKQYHKKENIKKELYNPNVKYTSEIVENIKRGNELKFNVENIRECMSRPFTKKLTYYDKIITHRVYQNHLIFPFRKQVINYSICVNTGNNPFNVLIVNKLPDLHFNGDSQTLSFYTFDSDNQKHDNITDWALNQFQTNYKDIKSITKQDIFYYTYGVLHSPQYRRKYEQNLKREFPRLPFYEDFTQWRDWGEELMDLHINYETIEQFALERKDLETSAKKQIAQSSLAFQSVDKRLDEFISKPRTKLRARKDEGVIEIDSITHLEGVPALAWEYKLGNRSALEWILDQYKEKKPSDATIAERFNTYKFEDYKEQVIDLLKRVCNVSIKTMKVIQKMPKE